MSVRKLRLHSKRGWSFSRNFIADILLLCTHGLLGWFRDFASVFFTEPNATQQPIMFIGATTVPTGPPTFRLRTNDVLVPQLLGRSFQKARNFTASSHQNAGFSISFQKFSGDDTPGPSRTQHPAGLWPGAVLRPKPWSPQLFSRGCAPDYVVYTEHGSAERTVIITQLTDDIQSAFAFMLVFA